MELKDTWLALKKTFELLGVIIVWSIVVASIYALSFTEQGIIAGLVWGIVYSPIMFLIFSKFIYGVWNAYNLGIIVDLENKTFSFPASDVENNVIDIITFKQFRDLSKREMLNLAEIEALANEIKRWTTASTDSKGKKTTKKHVKFLLNVSGDFGSRQLEFDSKQKRDECRAMLNSAKKKLNLKYGSSDLNLDLE
jgi:hypothetical protein